METKKNNTRKYAAVALGILGIAGLSLASAATLTVGEDSPIVGVSDSTECDSAVAVSYDTDYLVSTSPAFQLTEVTVSGISDLCVGKTVTVHVLNELEDTVLAEVTDTVPSGTGDQTVTITVPAGVDAEDVYEAAVSIS